jgi:hypothetical protein
MSEVARSIVEIYQPVIVGLGAVVLGSLANAALDWWREYLRNNKVERVLRRAILFELLELDERINNSISQFGKAKNPEFYVIKISTYLQKLDREKIGCLSKDEVTKISAVVGKIDGAAALHLISSEDMKFDDVCIIKANSITNANDIKIFINEYKETVNAAIKSISYNLG